MKLLTALRRRRFCSIISSRRTTSGLLPLGFISFQLIPSGLQILKRALVELHAPLDTVGKLRPGASFPESAVDEWNAWLDERRDANALKPRIESKPQKQNYRPQRKYEQGRSEPERQVEPRHPKTYHPKAYRPEGYRPEAYRPEAYRPEAYRPESHHSQVRARPALVSRLSTVLTGSVLALVPRLPAHPARPGIVSVRFLRLPVRPGIVLPPVLPPRLLARLAPPVLRVPPVLRGPPVLRVPRASIASVPAPQLLALIVARAPVLRMLGMLAGSLLSAEGD